jgi:hypothetical protein
VGRLLALDERFGVAHVAVLGFGDQNQTISHIQHMPVLATRLARSITSVAESPQFEQHEIWAQVQAWRAAHAANEAGAFSGEIGEAVEAVRQTVGEGTGPHIVETAYPIRDESGVFRIVRAITLSAETRPC